MKTHIITSDWVSLEKLESLLQEDVRLELSEESKKQIIRCRAYLNDAMASGERTIYGINTGFGSLCDTVIPADDLGQLQTNLVISHACGAGEEVPQHLVKRMLLLKVLGLSHGHSGVQLETVERLIFFFNNNILPVLYQQGSLGASGDLAPLAHLSLPLIGMGEAYVNNEKVSGEEICKQFKLTPIQLQSKEGLALLNGTQFMSSYGSYAVATSRKLWIQFNKIAALSLEGYDGRVEPFGVSVHAIRKQKGQIKTAEIFRDHLDGSQIISRVKAHVQDPYSFRCIPQVHGASYDAIEYAAQIIENEINAVTDNPTIFPDEDLIVSAGNFHGQPLAITMDFLAIAMAEMGSISERRVYKLISGTRGLPAFLVAKPGLNSGFMIPQYTCASIVSQNKQMCMPASVDTIDSSNGQEDHVSMGANSGTKLFRILDNLHTIQGIELMNAAQAIEFRRPLKTSEPLETLLTEYRKVVPFVKEDCYLQPLISASKNFVTGKI
ncbi:MAG: histidine ammonia-lyase [Crocinitomicaceae bacterium]|nr:histidine ammonia-lyase [Crocinitomicaceae bacterium]